MVKSWRSTCAKWNRTFEFELNWLNWSPRDDQACPMEMPTKHIGSKGNQSHFSFKNFFIIHCIVDITYTTGRSSPLSSLSELSSTCDIFSFLFEELRTISGELQIVSSSTDSVIEVFLQEKGETFSLILKTVFLCSLCFLWIFQFTHRSISSSSSELIFRCRFLVEEKAIWQTSFSSSLDFSTDTSDRLSFPSTSLFLFWEWFGIQGASVAIILLEDICVCKFVLHVFF